MELNKEETYAIDLEHIAIVLRLMKLIARENPLFEDNRPSKLLVHEYVVSCVQAFIQDVSKGDGSNY